MNSAPQRRFRHAPVWRRVTRTKWVLALAAAASFAAALVAARDAHVGTVSTPSGPAVEEDDAAAPDFFGDGAIAPAGNGFAPSAPGVRTGVS